MAPEKQEVAPATPAKKTKAAGSAKAAATAKAGKKKNQPGRYSQLVVDTLRKLGERNGSSLAKIYNEAKKVSWFDQQNGRTYLKYSIKALVQNDTLLQVKGIGANGSFKLNKKKLEGLPIQKKAAPPKAAAKKAAATKKATPAKKTTPAKSTPKKSPKKAKPAKKPTAKSPAKRTRKAPSSKVTKTVKKATKPKALRAKKA
ncbi:histone H1.10-like [Spea bombifrons]|uniref:histone H1.10-like n=1 Tax=Spea bombifrons TaxID=233779 RepID=UPI0023495A94|nr:histone H1.10-like [Spea bombifrons]